MRSSTLNKVTRPILLVFVVLILVLALKRCGESFRNHLSKTAQSNLAKAKTLEGKWIVVDVRTFSPGYDKSVIYILEDLEGTRMELSSSVDGAAYLAKGDHIVISRKEVGENEVYISYDKAIQVSRE